VTWPNLKLLRAGWTRMPVPVALLCTGRQCQALHCALAATPAAPGPGRRPDASERRQTRKPASAAAQLQVEATAASAARALSLQRPPGLRLVEAVHVPMFALASEVQLELRAQLHCSTADSDRRQAVMTL
jgi:hypothetical protein